MFPFPLYKSAQLCSGHGPNDFQGVGCQQLFELAHHGVSLPSPIMLIKWLERPIAFMTDWIYRIMAHYLSFSEFPLLLDDIGTPAQIAPSAAGMAAGMYAADDLHPIKACVLRLGFIMILILAALWLRQKAQNPSQEEARNRVLQEVIKLVENCRSSAPSSLPLPVLQ